MSISVDKMKELVEGQLRAYNERDIYKFAMFFHPEVIGYRLGSEEPFMRGIDQLRERYGMRFSENPHLHCEIKNRLILAETIMDEEWVTGETGRSQPTHVVAIYKFKDNLIHSIWFTY